MNNSRKLLNSEIINAFVCQFESDIIDWNNKGATLFNAEIVVDNLRFVGFSDEEIIRPFKEALNNWAPEVIEEFCEITSTDWLFDAEATEWLEAIIRRIIEYAEKAKPLGV